VSTEGTLGRLSKQGFRNEANDDNDMLKMFFGDD